MALTESTLIPLGTKAPDFSLPDVTNNQEIVTLQTVRSNIATVIMFICNHCPYVQHIITTVTSVAKKYQKKGVAFIAISANDVKKYPEDAPHKMQVFAKEQGFTFPYLYDESQAVAKAYHAACTPDFYVFDKTLAAVYHGRFDASSPGKTTPVTGQDLCDALDRVIAQQPPQQEQKPSIGCNIKWR